MVHLLALRRAELHLSNQFAEEQGSMPCASWSGLMAPGGARAQTRKETIWLAKIRERNRGSPAVPDPRRIRRRQSKPGRVRNGWPISAGTMGRRILSSRVGNGSPAGAAVRWSIPRKIAQLSLRNGTTTAGVRTILLDFAEKRRNVSSLIHAEIFPSNSIIARLR